MDSSNIGSNSGQSLVEDKNISYSQSDPNLKPKDNEEGFILPAAQFGDGYISTKQAVDVSKFVEIANNKAKEIWKIFRGLAIMTIGALTTFALCANPLFAGLIGGFIIAIGAADVIGGSSKLAQGRKEQYRIMPWENWRERREITKDFRKNDTEKIKGHFANRAERVTTLQSDLTTQRETLSQNEQNVAANKQAVKAMNEKVTDTDKALKVAENNEKIARSLNDNVKKAIEKWNRAKGDLGNAERKFAQAKKSYSEKAVDQTVTNLDQSESDNLQNLSNVHKETGTKLKEYSAAHQKLKDAQKAFKKANDNLVNVLQNAGNEFEKISPQAETLASSAPVLSQLQEPSPSSLEISRQDSFSQKIENAKNAIETLVAQLQPSNGDQQNQESDDINTQSVSTAINELVQDAQSEVTQAQDALKYAKQARTVAKNALSEAQKAEKSTRKAINNIKNELNRLGENFIKEGPENEKKDDSTIILDKADDEFYTNAETAFRLAQQEQDADDNDDNLLHGQNPFSDEKILDDLNHQDNQDDQ